MDRLPPVLYAMEVPEGGIYLPGGSGYFVAMPKADKLEGRDFGIGIYTLTSRLTQRHGEKKE